MKVGRLYTDGRSVRRLLAATRDDVDNLWPYDDGPIGSSHDAAYAVVESPIKRGCYRQGSRRSCTLAAFAKWAKREVTS